VLQPRTSPPGCERQDGLSSHIASTAHPMLSWWPNPDLPASRPRCERHEVLTKACCSRREATPSKLRHLRCVAARSCRDPSRNLSERRLGAAALQARVRGAPPFNAKDRSAPGGHKLHRDTLVRSRARHAGQAAEHARRPWSNGLYAQLETLAAAIAVGAKRANSSENPKQARCVLIARDHPGLGAYITQVRTTYAASCDGTCPREACC
jgi:hypothetical protein